jgi:hypothetical protein
VPTLWQIGQFQDAFVSVNHLSQAYKHHVAFIPISRVATVELPAAPFIILVVVIVIFMHNVCDPVAVPEYALVR